MSSVTHSHHSILQRSPSTAADRLKDFYCSAKDNWFIKSAVLQAGGTTNAALTQLLSSLNDVIDGIEPNGNAVFECGSAQVRCAIMLILKVAKTF